MLRDELECAIEWILEWLEDRDNRERISKAIAMIVDDVNDWMKELG